MAGCGGDMAGPDGEPGFPGAVYVWGRGVRNLARERGKGTAGVAACMLVGCAGGDRDADFRLAG